MFKVNINFKADLRHLILAMTFVPGTSHRVMVKIQINQVTSILKMQHLLFGDIIGTL